MRVGVHFSQWRLGWRILREARHLNSAVSAFFGTHSSNLEIMGKYIFSEHESVFFFLQKWGKPSLFKCEREIRFHMKGGNNYYILGGLCNHLSLVYLHTVVTYLARNIPILAIAMFCNNNTVLKRS